MAVDLLVVKDVVLHLGFFAVLIVGEVTVEVNVASRYLRHLESEVRHEVVALSVVLHIVAVAHIVLSVLIHIVAVIDALFVREKDGMVIGLFKDHVVHPHRRLVFVKNLKASVFVAGREDEIAVVLEK